MRVLATAAVGACLLALAGCADDSDLTDGLEEIGTTGSGASVYATRVDPDRVRVLVMQDGDSWCNASGPSNENRFALCSDTFDDGSSYVATVGKDVGTWAVCDQTSGAAIAVERIETPTSWAFDLIVGLTRQQGVSGVPCDVLPG